MKDLLARRTQAMEHLTALERADASWKDFYGGRRAALQALALTTSRESATVTASMDPREAAQRALKTGDMKGLAKLADTLMAAVTPGKGGPATHELAAGSTHAPEQPPADLLTSGLYDLLGISRDYDSERVMARFAVVRRERMVAW